MSSRELICNPSLRYMPQLDGLRGLGVLVVMLQHLATVTLRATHTASLAVLGLFFTLSSYLITSILLRSRSRIERAELTSGGAWRSYFARRARRIFPAYFLVLALAYVTDVGEMRRDIGWHATYLSNLLFQDPDISTASIHLWSLSVEEQFYLVWPLFILLCPRALMPVLMGVLVVISVAYRIHVLPGTRAAMYATPSQADYLAFGALFAWLESLLPTRPALQSLWVALPRIALGVGLALVALRWSSLVPGAEAKAHVLRASYCFLCLFLVTGAARGFTGPFGALLQHRAVLAIGEASYGAYLIHMYIGPWVRPQLLRVGFDVAAKDWSLVVVLLPLSLLWAMASYRFIEAPLMSKGP